MSRAGRAARVEIGNRPRTSGRTPPEWWWGRSRTSARRVARGERRLPGGPSRRRSRGERPGSVITASAVGSELHAGIDGGYRSVRGPDIRTVEQPPEGGTRTAGSATPPGVLHRVRVRAVARPWISPPVIASRASLGRASCATRASGRAAPPSGVPTATWLPLSPARPLSGRRMP
jgi:hypothetical protein